MHLSLVRGALDMSKTCLKCGYENPQPSDDALAECPKCGAIYSRVEEALKARSPQSGATAAASGSSKSRKFPVDFGDVRVRYAAVAVIAFMVGVFTGREHIKYELRSAMREAASGFVGALSGKADPAPPEASTRPVSDLPVGEGPFGLVRGLSLEQLGTSQQLEPGKYKLNSVPKPHSSFESYIVQVGPHAGLCWIKAIGKDVRTSGFGIELKSAFDDMRSRLESTYGRPELYDRLLPEANWDEPKYFMMSLLKKERLLASVWKSLSGSSAGDSLKSVGLIASASGIDRGFLSIEYSFTNEDECEREIKASQDGAL